MGDSARASPETRQSDFGLGSRATQTAGPRPSRFISSSPRRSTTRSTRAEAVKRLQDNLKRAKTVVNTLEFAARVNREMGLGSDTAVGGVTLIFQSNLKPGALRRRAGSTGNVRREWRGRDTKDGSA
jgi:hypothetical protein